LFTIIRKAPLNSLFLALHIYHVPTY
jgi:hypothetical protein